MGPGGGLRDTEEAAGARGEGLEPSITGPEPVVLPITPPPNGWAFRLAEGPTEGIRLAEGARDASERRPHPSGVVQPLQVVVADDPPQSDAERLLQEVGHCRPARDG